MAMAQAHLPGKYIFVWQTGSTCWHMLWAEERLHHKCGCSNRIFSPGSVDEIDAEALRYEFGGHFVVNNAQLVWSLQQPLTVKLIRVKLWLMAL